MQRFFSVVIVSLFVGCSWFRATAPGVEPDPQQPIGLGEGDVVEIKVFRQRELDSVYRISAAGTVDFPLIGEIQLKGQTPDAIADAIEVRLRDGYLKRPQVSVFVTEHNSKKIHVLGQVSRTGSFRYRSGMTVIEALAEAGGLTRLASANRVRLTRAGAEEHVEIPVGDIQSGQAMDIKLRPGDIIFVPESLF